MGWNIIGVIGGSKQGRAGAPHPLFWGAQKLCPDGGGEQGAKTKKGRKKHIEVAKWCVWGY